MSTDPAVWKSPRDTQIAWDLDPNSILGLNNECINCVLAWTMCHSNHWHGTQMVGGWVGSVFVETKHGSLMANVCNCITRSGVGSSMLREIRSASQRCMLSQFWLWCCLSLLESIWSDVNESVAHKIANVTGSVRTWIFYCIFFQMMIKWIY